VAAGWTIGLGLLMAASKPSVVGMTIGQSCFNFGMFQKKEMAMKEFLTPALYI
jgi:hypothetical protein